MNDFTGGITKEAILSKRIDSLLDSGVQEAADDEAEAPRPYRVLVTGARDWPDEGSVWRVLDIVLNSVDMSADRRPFVVVEGGCPTGADLYARRWVAHKRDHDHRTDVSDETHPADWARHGTMAGPLRNAAMAKLGADQCHGFITPTARGTWGCLKEAAKRNIPVFITQHFTA